jgi:hypothetical protein
MAFCVHEAWIRHDWEYFALDSDKMNLIVPEAKPAVAKWQMIAKEVNLARSEQDLVAPAFWVDSLRKD